MVYFVDESVSVDKQGRLVVPAHLRQSLGIKDGGRVMIYQDGKKIVLEPINEDVERSVKEWSRKAREMATSMNTEASSTSGKWMSDEYAKKKLGLL